MSVRDRVPPNIIIIITIIITINITIIITIITIITIIIIIISKWSTNALKDPS